MYEDPTTRAALQSLDFGSVYSLDGREHPVTGMTPVYAVDPTTTPAVNVDPTSVSLPSVPSFLMPKHIGARFVVGLIAVAIIIVVAIRITL